MEVIKTICGGCAQSDCGIDVYVDNGQIVKIKGTDGYPYNNGNICPKGISSAHLITDPNRVKHPLKRIGERGDDKWAEISWEEALDTIAAKINQIRDEDGPERLGIFRGAGPGWEGSLMFLQRFMNAFGSANYCCQIHKCKGPRIVVTGTMMGGEPDMDIENTQCLLLWASNTAETSLPNYWSRISKAKTRGAKLIAIDSRFSKSASKADIFARIRPGTDGALALGLAHILIKENLYDQDFVENYGHGFAKYSELAAEFNPDKVEEITGVPQELIREIAMTYGGIKPAILFVGNGIEQLTNTMQTMRAIYCLPGLTGNIGAKGGHLLASPLPFPDIALKSRFFSELLDKSVSRHKFYHSRLAGGAMLTQPDLYDAMATGEPYYLRAALCIGNSFLTVIPEEKKYKEILKDKLELIVVHDPFMTREARELADIVLPATTFLECWRLRFMRPGFKPSAYLNHVGLQRPVVAPVGESRSDEELFMELGRRIGLAEYFPWDNVLGFVDEVVKPLGITADDLVKKPEGISYPIPEKDVVGFYKDKGFNTPTKKFEFYNTSFEENGFDPLPRYVEPAESPISMAQLKEEYPLVLSLGIKTVLFTHTQFHTFPLLNKLMPDPWVEIHPEKAQELGIGDGDLVRVESPRDQISLKAKVTEKTTAPDVVHVAYGWSDYSVNNLSTNYPRDPICGAPGNHALICRIEKI